MASKNAVAKKPKDTKGTLLRMLSYMSELKWIMLGIMLLCITGNILGLLGPSLAGNAINEAAAGPGKVDFDKVFYFTKRMLIFCLIS